MQAAGRQRAKRRPGAPGSAGHRATGRIRRAFVAGVLAPMLGVTALVVGASPATATDTYVVTVTTDEADVAVGDSICEVAAGGCSLRAALQESQADAADSVIGFAIPGTGPHTIDVSSPLPLLIDGAGGTTIDGYTQPGANPNTASFGSDASIQVALRGIGSSGHGALTIYSSGNIVRGLALYDFAGAVRLLGESATDNEISGNFIGTDPTGTFAAAAFDNLAIGVTVNINAAGNVIGGPDLADRNVISGNAGRGIGFFWDTANNAVENNVIGLSPTGAPLGNLGHGIDLNYRANNTTIGGDAPGLGNVVSANGGEGIEVSHGAETAFNLIAGNVIGGTLDGLGASDDTANARNGVLLEDRVSDNTVRGNVIVANGSDFEGGIKINNQTRRNVIEDNRIGVTLADVPVENGGIEGFAIKLETDATDNRIGPDNLIVGQWRGVWVSGDTSVRNTITRNLTHGQTHLAIDLAPTDVHNPNDPGDADTGPNDLLNWPALSITSPGVVHAATCAGCRVELFESSGIVGPGEHGPPIAHLADGVADASGEAMLFPQGFGADRVITATSTDPTGNTSELATNAALPAANPANLTPTPSFVTSCLRLACTLDASASSDPDGAVVHHVWDFGDATSGAGVAPAHAFAANGTYDVTLTVHDDQGAIASTTQSVVVFDEPPTAAASASCQFQYCTFDGTASSDPDGAVANWAWDFGDGSVGGGSSAEHTFAADGTYTITLTVSDDDGISNTTTLDVTVDALPIDTLVYDSFSRTLTNAWGSDELSHPYTLSSGGASSFAVTGGRGRVTVSSAGASRAAVLAGIVVTDVEATARFDVDKLPVGNGGRASIELRRTANNTQYRARVRIDAAGRVFVAFTRLAGTGSEITITADALVAGLTAVAGQGLRLKAQATGTNPTNLRIKVWSSSGTEPGSWTLETTDSTAALQAAGGVGLAAALSSGATNTPIQFRFDDFSARVLDNPPTAAASAICVNQTCTFDGTASADDEGPIATYAWDFGDGTEPGDGGIVVHDYADFGDHTATLTVTDTLGWTASADVAVTLTNQAPVSVPDVQCVLRTCTFDGAASNDPDGTVVGYVWLIDGGQVEVSGQLVIYTFTLPGTYSVELLVEDDDGATDSEAIEITVTGPPNQPPTAEFDSMCTYLTCTFDASASTDSDGTITAYQWDLGDGLTANTIDPIVTYTVPGDYPVRLLVTDNENATSSIVHHVVAAPVPYVPAVGNDDFARVTTSGWGSAPLGGNWSALYASWNAAFAADGAVGTVTVPTAGVTRGARLSTAMPRDLSSVVTLSTNKTATGGSQMASLTSRFVSGAGEYRARTRFTGSVVRLALVRTSPAGSETVLTETIVSGLTHAAGTQYRVRFEVEGESPTSLRARIWPAIDPEPVTWNVQTTDSTAALQSAGLSGITTYLSSSTTNAPVTFTFDDLVIERKNLPPSAAFAASCLGLDCAFDSAGSIDPDGTITAIQWNFGDGTTASGTLAPTHVFSEAGTYPVTLTVYDDVGQWSSVTIDVATT